MNISREMLKLARELVGKNVETKNLNLTDRVIHKGKEWVVVDAKQNREGEYSIFTLEGEDGRKTKIYGDKVKTIEKL